MYNCTIMRVTLRLLYYNKQFSNIRNEHFYSLKWLSWITFELRTPLFAEM